MKTQLLQDFEESGSAPQTGAAATGRGMEPPAPLPAASSVAGQPSRARKRAVADLLLQRATDAAQFDAARSRQRAPQGNWSGAPPAPLPDPPPAESMPTAAAQATPSQAPSLDEAPFPEPPPTPRDAGGDDGAGLHAASTADDLPAWLSERLREDEVRNARRELRQRWTRRALFGGTAAAVLALLAGAGWWLYQDNRVDGALTVVANTSAPVQAAAPLAHAGAGAGTQTGAITRAREAAPTVQPAPATPALPPQFAADTPAAPAAPAPPIAVPSNASGDATQSTAAPDPDPAAPQPPVKHRQAAQAVAEPASSRRREETLMQCRALGYDERQCLRRGCAMTRFGLACRG